jgi:Histidine kinase
LRLWLRPAAYGLGLGAAIALLEYAYYYPLVTTPNRLGVASLLASFLTWCGEGALFALMLASFVQRAVARPPATRQLILAVTVACAAAVLAWQALVHFIVRERFGIWLFRDHLGQPADFTGTVLYHMWLVLFFGGLAAALYVSRQRHARMLAVLRAAELERETSQRRLAEARLAALQAHVDPEFLFHTLARLEQLYEADPPGADRLLEELIAFLRRALADIRLQTFKEST